MTMRLRKNQLALVGSQCKDRQFDDGVWRMVSTKREDLLIEEPSALRANDFLILPSHRKLLDQVIIEAWESGSIPVALQGSGCAAKILRATGGGLRYKSGDPRTLGDCIKLRIRARRKGVRKHDRARMCVARAQLLAERLRRRDGGDPFRGGHEVKRLVNQ